MKKKHLGLSALLFLGTSFLAQAQDTNPSPVRFVNTGKMAVAANDGETALYVPHSVLMQDSENSEVSILQQGITSIGGSFYQESAGNVFQVNDEGWGTSTGTVVFSGDNANDERFVTPRTTAIAAFDRTSQYVAFPNIVIATDDAIRIPGLMGIDAATIARQEEKNGVVYLRSDIVEGKVYDASLRISEAGTSADLVAAGSVVVEKELSIYRAEPGLLFPFAAPFTNLRAGYFSGNFVRRLLEEEGTGHVNYVLGNRDLNGDNMIDEEQYITSALETFSAGRAYLVKPRTSGFDYGDLHFDVTEGTPSTLYDKGKFIFDGNANGLYNMDKVAKQLYSEDELFSLNLNTTYSKTINLVIGNSYSSAISMEKLYDALATTGLNFSSTIYYFVPGSATWTPYNLVTNAPNFENLTEIPAHSAVMLRLSRNKVQNGTFSIGREMQTHGSLSHNMLRSASQYNNELVFTVSPEENSNVIDRALVALRPTTSGTIAKISNPDKEIFQLAAGNNSSIAVVQEGTSSVPLTFRASKETDDYLLSVSRVESMTTEGVWLEDRQTNRWTNLREQDTYKFQGEADDNINRFYIHFTAQDVTNIDNISQAPLQAYYANNAIHIRGLVANDSEASIQVSDTQGRKLLSSQVSNFPEESIQINLSAGVYLVHIGGERNQTVKILIKGGAL